MPLYEYECQTCQRVMELMQKFSDPELEKCPDCGGPIKRLMSRTSFQLKGSGWYSSDYKKAPQAPTEPKAPTPATTTSSGCSSESCGKGSKGDGKS